MGLDVIAAPIGQAKRRARSFAREHFAEQTVVNKADGSEIVIP